MAAVRDAFWGFALALVLLANPATADETPWPNYNNGYEGQRYSPLKQIDTTNAAHLAEACQVGIGGPGPFETGLIMIDGRLYATVGRDTVAIDARTCAIIWKHSYTPEEPEMIPANRGPAVMDGRVFRGTADGRLLALDAATGKLLWKDVVGNPKLSEFVSSAPLAWNGVVYVGIAGGDWGARGRMMAFDAVTGRELWRFNTIPSGSETGASSWHSAKAAKTGGGALWTTYTLDVTTGEIFLPVGNPAPDFATGYRPGENLFTDSIVVLDAHSGALKWWYQLTPHDGQDHDLSAAPVLIRDSDVRDIVAFAGKDGYLQAVDRDTHKLIYRLPLGQIVNEGAAATPAGTRICPGWLGGVEWNGPAYEPVEHNLLVGSVDWCGTVYSGDVHFTGGQAFMGGKLEMDKSGTGWVTAIDAATGKIRWRYHADAAVIAGVTPTAGGITMTGDMNGNFLALDSRTGAVLRQMAAGGAMAGGLITYAIDEKQYVAFTAGNVSRVTFGELGNPTIHILALPDSDLAPPAASDHGKNLFAQICVNCHGADGSAVAGHDLKTLKDRKDFAATVGAIKDPTPPMPRLYPSQLSEADVHDLASYLQQGL